MGRLGIAGLAVLGLGWGALGANVLPLQTHAWDDDSIEALAYPPFLVDPATAARYRQQGLAFRATGSLDRSIAALKIAAALDPYNTNSYLVLGWTQHLAGTPEAAIVTLKHALQQDPNQVQALNALGIVYLVEGRLDEATATHHRALALKPDNEITHYNLSLAYDGLGQWERAIYHAQQATALEPHNPHPWVALALAQTASDRPHLAQDTYQRAIDLDPRYRQRAYLDHLTQAGFSDTQIQTVADLQARLRP